MSAKCSAKMDSDFSVFFEIEGEPVAKGRARKGLTKTGKTVVYTPAKTANYETVGAFQARQAMKYAGYSTPWDGPLVVIALVERSIPKSWSKKKKEEARLGAIRPTSRPDLDNYLKIILDSCNGIVFCDDSQIVEIAAGKIYGDHPRVLVKFSGLVPHGTFFERFYSDDE